MLQRQAIADVVAGVVLGGSMTIDERRTLYLCGIVIALIIEGLL